MKVKLLYRVEIKKKALSVLKKLDDKIGDRCLKRIQGLAKDPIPTNKKHILDIMKGGSMLCEVSVDKIRIYYEIHHGNVIINECEYLGEVAVVEASSSHKSGSKKNYSRQQKAINFLKKAFRRRKE